MIATQFNTGNFNENERLFRKVIPEKFEIIKKDIVPSVDKVLISMLGASTNVEKISANIEQKFSDSNGLYSLTCTLVYNCFDFKVPNAPEKAIRQDIENISAFLQRDDCMLKRVNIDTNTGTLVVAYEMLLDRM